MNLLSNDLLLPTTRTPVKIRSRCHPKRIRNLPFVTQNKRQEEGFIGQKNSAGGTSLRSE